MFGTPTYEHSLQQKILDSSFGRKFLVGFRDEAREVEFSFYVSHNFKARNTTISDAVLQPVKS